MKIRYAVCFPYVCAETTVMQLLHVRRELLHNVCMTCQAHALEILWETKYAVFKK